LEKNNSFLLRVKDLSISYGNIIAIREINLKVEKGEIVTLIGANGAGKSTLVKGILGIQRPSRGSISFLGQDITWTTVDRIVASGIVLVPEGRGIVMEMTVMENLELGAYHRREGVLVSMEQVFEQFPILRERKHQKAGLLSGGQQQILAIGRALMADPVLIMMDEPSLGLAPILVHQVFEIIAGLKKSGHTILLAEQNARKATQIADRGYVFEKGRIILEGPSQDLIHNEMVSKAYLGG
jgi:branched-chain amino acid transport system ATP-binding protein